MKEQALPSVSDAKLPRSYERAKQALATCANMDECQEWAKKAEAMASYAKQAGDDSLRKMADRIQARAIRRCGELLKQIEPAKNQYDAANKSVRIGAGASSRSGAAKKAGLSNDIAQAAEALVNNGETPKSWVIQSVLKSHSEVYGVDADMALYCMRETVAARVNKHFAGIKATEEEQPQMPLPGFERLQRRYVITRKNEQTIVSVYHMTDAELEAKAQEMETMAEGCLQHADELRKFKDERVSAFYP